VPVLSREDGKYTLAQLREEVVRTPVLNWRKKQSRFRLLVADFAWLSRTASGTRVIRPEGEHLWALWDIARHIVRNRAEVSGTNPGRIQTTGEGRELQCEIFKRLQFADLQRRYTAEVHTHLDAIVVLAPSAGRTQVIIVRNRDKAPIVTAAIVSSTNHPSEFWQRTDVERRDHQIKASQIVDSLLSGDLPIYRVSGRPPFMTLAHIVSERVLPIV